MTQELNRHDIRIRAFQTLFALNANPEADKQVLYQQLLTDDGKLELKVPAYLDELVSGVLDNQAALDEKIKQYLMQGWTLSRIAKTDLVILRLAFFEMDNEPDIPKRVALNEALELAKQFSDDRSRRFINGVLAHEVESN
ncbi:transcription antitermination factor NusB [Secundilactobacillus collinoides]|uniref:Transcription antitermination protein NusB n=2 Tax=Secundilactobacillus collinoides TaxID=33960 RepID=A0A0R2BPE3_SECCO|nr:transcription antitermination factor NusB [Secundilactobacillus collinoides]KRM77372.1 transcription antitermination protein NusB [Secundilactobacillus collinoides DSM 20515 = JCM 1123]KZL40484.1 antitermination protein NusB [Secundilactobacillus collinoides]